MSLALSSGLLFAPALASRLNQPPPPSAILAGADDDAELAAVAEPLGDIFAPLTAEPAAEDEVAAAAFGPDAAEVSTPPAAAAPERRAPRVVKAAAVPSAAPKAKPKPKPPPPPKPAKGAAPAKPKPAAKPEPKPEAKPKPAPPAALAAKTSAQKTEAETLACIRRVESGGNYGAVSPSGIYRGAYQMDDDFWRKYGGDAALTGRHEQASAAQQDAVAGRGFRDRGLDPWPSAVTECA